MVSQEAAMTLEPLLTAPTSIQLHVAMVLTAIIPGTWLLYLSRKGSRGHRAIGILFLGLMVLGALSALFIRRADTHSTPLAFWLTHISVPVVLLMAWLAVRAAMRGNIKLHRFCVSGLFMGGLMVNMVINLSQSTSPLHRALFTTPTHLEARLDAPQGDTVR
jgi:uncharacterized membrane protein